MSSDKKNIEPSELLSLYWNFFQLHSEQRMKIVELFITVETILFGVFAVQFGKNLFLSIIISAAVSLIALIFIRLDIRATNLLHDCRIAIRKTENKYMAEYPQEIRLFNNIKKNEKTLQFSKSIRACYITVCIIGVAMIFISIFA